MTLVLEVIGVDTAKAAAGIRCVFTAHGGIIGRDESCAWVLAHTKVSARHATISYSNGVFYIEDTSRNGVFINSVKNRLDRGRPYPLRSGDRLYIDPYEIRASIEEDEDSASGPVSEWTSAARSGPQRWPDAHVPASSEGLRQSPVPLSITPRSLAVAPGQEVDPLKLLDPGPAPMAAPRRAASGPEFHSPVDAHYRPPAAIVPPPAASPLAPAPASIIPADYDPLKPDDPYDFSSWGGPVEAADQPPLPPRVESAPLRSPEEQAVREKTPLPGPRSTPLPEPSHPVAPETPGAALVAAAPPADSGVGELLAAAGVEAVAATPELARSLGRILRVVVSGVMDVLRSRQQIKDEFRLRTTQFRPADNNPLKFSANIDDALHNLLVKRNPAYLRPVEAFEDAFADVRNHQLAMLAGMRVAFESMLATFAPDRMQSDFDHRLKAGWGLGMTAKLRYWDCYRELHEEMIKDPEATFRRLFGEEFARAYEQQLQRLQAETHKAQAGIPREPGDL